MQKISLFIFDLDGTLIDSKQDIAGSVNYTMDVLGLPALSNDLIYEFVGNGVTPLIQKSIESAGENQAYQHRRCVEGEAPAALPTEGATRAPMITFNKALEIFKAHYQEHCLDTTLPFQGVAKILEHFHAVPKVVVTNKSQGFSETILKGLDLTQYLEGIFGGDTPFPKKPDPSIVFHLMKQYNTSPSGTVIVGDSAIDMETGKNAGILTCGVTYGFRPRKEILDCKPGFVIEKAEDLIEIFVS